MIKRPIKRGRPKIEKPLIDQGTPELQGKRQAVLKSLNLKSDSPNYLSRAFKPAIFDGCYLHQLLYRDLLTEEQFETGLYIRKIYSLCLRSQGLKNRLLGSFKISGFKEGRTTDLFENQEIEEKWRYTVSFIKQYTKNPSYMRLILKVILNDSFKEETYSILNLNDNFLKILRDNLDKLAFINRPLYSYWPAGHLH
jgi:hypothetical protein